MRLAVLPLVSAIAVLQAVPAVAQRPDSVPSTRHLAIRAARLIDGRGGPPLQNAVILIDSARITAVGAEPRHSRRHQGHRPRARRPCSPA